MNIVKANSPYLRRKDSSNRLMIDVIIALAPVVIFSLVIYQLYALRNILVSVAVMELCEFGFVMIKNRIPYDGEKHTFKEKWTHSIAGYRLNNFLTTMVSALIFAMLMPPSSEPGGIIWAALICGALFGSIIGKLVFGGTGKNVFNPAAVGVVFAYICFSSYFRYPGSTLMYEVSSESLIDATLTPLSNIVSTNAAGGLSYDLSSYSVLDLFPGSYPSEIGISCAICIIVGFVYLVVRHAADFRITLSYVGTYAVLMLFAGIIVHAGDSSVGIGDFLGYQLLTGGVLFGAVYMATDPVTSPMTRPGKLIYGAVLGVCTAMIRLFGSVQCIAYSILLGNIATYVIDYPRWSHDRYGWKNLLALGIIIVCALLIVVWALCTEVFA